MNAFRTLPRLAACLLPSWLLFSSSALADETATTAEGDWLLSSTTVGLVVTLLPAGETEVTEATATAGVSCDDPYTMTWNGQTGQLCCDEGQVFYRTVSNPNWTPIPQEWEQELGFVCEDPPTSI